MVAEILHDEEELALVDQKKADAVWNESFKRRVRSAILGSNMDKDRCFEETIRKMVDCRLIGYFDLAQVVNYLGSHDVEGFRNERLHDFLENNGIEFKEERIKLAFVCLLTAVGIPMILAGDEFADQHDLKVVHPEKQMDAVNFERLAIPWRRRVFDHVSRLVKLRTSHPALGMNDTEFIHADFNDGKRVMAWVRGKRNTADMVVIVANFSGWTSQSMADGRSEYVVHNWPSVPEGMHWKEVTQDRVVPTAWAGKEPIFSWEAKVYVTAE